MATKTRRRYDEPAIPDHDDPVDQENAEAIEGRRRPASIRPAIGFRACHPYSSLTVIQITITSELATNQPGLEHADCGPFI
jgi:hypothetical protein